MNPGRNRGDSSRRCAGAPAMGAITHVLEPASGAFIEYGEKRPPSRELGGFRGAAHDHALLDDHYTTPAVQCGMKVHLYIIVDVDRRVQRVARQRRLGAVPNTTKEASLLCVK